MNYLKIQLEQRRTDERGINMVDLMMWLVIAALLLAAAIQGIGYYQQAANLNNMKSDLDGVGARVMSTSALGDGNIDFETLDEGAANSNWTDGVRYTVEESLSGGQPYIRAQHSDVKNNDVVYLIEACGDLNAGVNVVPKTGLAGCGIAQLPQDGPTVEAQQLTFTTLDTDVNKDWYGMGISDDGKTIVAGGEYGYLYTSTDGGATLIQHTELPANSRWRGIDASADGSKMIAAKIGGYIYVSDNYGVNWKAVTTSTANHWYDAEISDDGSRIAAVDYQGNVHISTDFGANWIQTSPVGVSKRWYSIESSNNGMTMAIARTTDYVYSSTDGGMTWKKRTGTGTGNWRSVTVSSDGSKIGVLGDNYTGGSYLYTSGNGGATWNAREVAGVKSGGGWYDMSMSADGSTIAAANVNAPNNYVYISEDGGQTWARQDNLGQGAWRGVALTNDGDTLLTGNHSGAGLFVGSI